VIPRLDFDPPPSQQFVTTDQAADLLRVKPTTVRQWASRGRIAAVGRAHGRPVYRLADVLRQWSSTTRRAA
jgi:excisionase family DNA binding protein